MIDRDTVKKMNTRVTKITKNNFSFNKFCLCSLTICHFIGLRKEESRLERRFVTGMFHVDLRFDRSGVVFLFFKKITRLRR